VQVSSLLGGLHQKYSLVAFGRLIHYLWNTGQISTLAPSSTTRFAGIFKWSPGQVLSNGIIQSGSANPGSAPGRGSYVLTTTEFARLRALLIRPGAILPRFELEERLYSENEQVESNSVDFLIHGIREKLGADVI
jgi:hypothetical protein